MDPVACGYGDLTVIRDVSLSVYADEIPAALGRNGAGKATTLRAVSGLEKVQSDRVCPAGTDLTRLSSSRRVRSGIAYVQEGKRIFHRLSVEENLLVGDGYSDEGERRWKVPSGTSTRCSRFWRTRGRCRPRRGLQSTIRLVLTA